MGSVKAVIIIWHKNQIGLTYLERWFSERVQINLASVLNLGNFNTLLPFTKYINIFFRKININKVY